jgi:general secretion pathway protein E
VRENASDIHIEPFENRLVVRFRVDGVLREILRPHRKSIASPVVSRIKVMAKLDIAEKRLPQDGRIGCASPGARSTCASPPFPPASASAWCCACWTSRPGA